MEFFCAIFVAVINKSTMIFFCGNSKNWYGILTATTYGLFSVVNRLFLQNNSYLSVTLLHSSVSNILKNNYQFLVCLFAGSRNIFWFSNYTATQKHMFVSLGNSHHKLGGCIISSKNCNFSLRKIAKCTYSTYMKKHIENSIRKWYLSWKVVSRKFSEYLALKFPSRQKLSFSQINLQIVCQIEIQLSFLMLLFTVNFLIYMGFCRLFSN